jgi:hypothetical protein
VLNSAWKGTEAGMGVCAGGSRPARPPIRQGLGSTTTLWQAKEQDVLGSFWMGYSYETCTHERRS